MAADTEQCQGYTNKESGVTRAGTAIKRSLSNARDAPNAVLWLAAEISARALASLWKCHTSEQLAELKRRRGDAARTLWSSSAPCKRARRINWRPTVFWEKSTRKLFIGCNFIFYRIEYLKRKGEGKKTPLTGHGCFKICDVCVKSELLSLYRKFFSHSTSDACVCINNILTYLIMVLIFLFIYI